MNRKITADFVDTNRHWTLKNIGLAGIKREDSIKLWKSDYRFVQLFVRCNEDSFVEVNARMDEDVTVELFTLEPTMAFIGHAGWYAFNRAGVMPTGPKVRINDILTPYRPFNLVAGGYKCVMAKVVSTSKIGMHTIYFDVLSDDEEVETLTLQMEVLDIDMPSSSDYSYTTEYWQHPFNVAEYYHVEPWSEEHLAILKEHQLFYKAIGGRGVVCTMLDEVWGGQTYSANKIRYPSMIKWIYDGRKWRFDYTDFDKWVELNKSIGLDDKFICYSMMPWGSKMRYYHERKGRCITRTVPTSLPWLYRRAWRVFLEDFTRHLDDLGIFDSIYIGFDERNNMRMILDFLNKFENKDGHHFKVAASFNNYVGNRACLDRIDSVSVGMDEIREHEAEFKEIVKERNKVGKFTSMYTATEHFPNSFALSVPAESYYTMMYSYTLGNNGFLRWAFDAWVKDPLVDTTHWSFQAGDCFLIYPNKNGMTPLWSYRLLKLDEALRDANKLTILRQKSKLAGRIDNMMAKIGKDYLYKIEYDPSWGKAIRKAKWATDESRESIISDVEAIENTVEELSELYLDN